VRVVIRKRGHRQEDETVRGPSSARVCELMPHAPVAALPAEAVRPSLETLRQRGAGRSALCREQQQLQLPRPRLRTTGAAGRCTASEEGAEGWRRASAKARRSLWRRDPQLGYFPEGAQLPK